MAIRVKLGGDLKRYGDGSTIRDKAPITVADAMARLGVEEEPDDVLVIVNDEVVPPGEREGFTLNDDDRLALMPQIKGG